MSKDRAHPLKTIQQPFRPARVTVVMVTCIPSSSGYYQDRYRILKICIQSLIKHAGEPFDLLVFDNGSEPTVVDFLVALRNSGAIQYLTLSEKNIRLAPALNAAFAAAPGELIAYTDDDVFFYPKWLSKQLEILDQFPNVGIVGGQLVLGDAIHSSVKVVAKNNGICIEPFSVPRSWVEKWCKNMNLDVDCYIETDAANGTEYFKISSHGVEALSGGTGYSYVFSKQLLAEVPKFKNLGSGVEAKWHKSVDERGLMRLTTPDITTDHIGNVLDDYWVREADRFGIAAELSSNKFVGMKRKSGNWLIRRSKVQRTLKWVIGRLSRLIY